MSKEYVPLEKLLPATNGEIYKLVLLAAKRAAMLAEGGKPLVAKRTEKFLDTALEEIGAKMIRELKGKKKTKEKNEEEKTQNSSQEKAEEKEESSAR